MRYKTDFQAFLSIASNLAQEAAKVVMEFRKNPIVSNKKADKSPVTEADLAADKIIREGLAKNFPDHGILTEESGLSGNKNSEWIWVVDPLDGTRAYAKGIAGFAVQIGLLKAGKPCLGVVVDPLEGFIYEAAQGEGASLTVAGKKTKLEVSSRNDFERMPLIVSTDFPKEKLKEVTDRFHFPLLEPINSVGIKVGLVVRQKADIYFNHHSVHYWDTCAPQAILEAAGGKFTQLDGSPITYPLGGSHQHEGMTLATNGTRHEELLRQLDFIRDDD
jgi:3'(2'), 5'-bisphosphate nucleotidase